MRLLTFDTSLIQGLFDDFSNPAVNERPHRDV
jgi:hypothetical protein